MLIKPERPPSVPTPVEQLGKNLAFDSNGQLTDRTISGVESVKQWIGLALKNRKYTVPIYNFSDSFFGIDTIGMYEQHYPVYIAGLEADIRTTLSSHPSIRNLSSFRFDRSGRTLTVSFDVYLDSEQKDTFEFILEVGNGRL